MKRCVSRNQPFYAKPFYAKHETSSPAVTLFVMRSLVFLPSYACWQKRDRRPALLRWLKQKH
jgi:hypothetical protein